MYIVTEDGLSVLHGRPGESVDLYCTDGEIRHVVVPESGAIGIVPYWKSCWRAHDAKPTERK